MKLSEPLQPSGTMPADPGDALQPGELLENFEILQVLGLTSCGVLYFARNQQDGSTAAIKEYMPSTLAAREHDGHIIPTSLAYCEAYERGLHAFLTEALTLSQFDQPHLLRVTSIWEANGTAYRSMPYLPGTTLLARRTAANRPMSQAELQSLRDGLLSALHTLYAAGLAHGRVEPVNIYMTEDGQSVLMDFDAVHLAVLSDPDKPHVDAYADPSKTETLMAADLQAVAAVLHFSISGDWQPPRSGQTSHHEPLADALLRFKDSASVLDYQPEFLSAIDAALSLPPAQRPGTITEFRALFEAKPAAPPAAKPTQVSDTSDDESPRKRSRRPRREPLPAPPPAYPLNSNESVLALLANFDRGPAAAAEDVEPFENPEVPTLTEEAEPALPPLRSNPFDEMEAAVEAQDEGVDPYRPLHYTPMPRVPQNPWRRRLVVAGLAAAVAAGLGALGFQLFG